MLLFNLVEKNIGLLNEIKYEPLTNILTKSVELTHFLSRSTF